MKIINLTKDTILVENAAVADNIFYRIKGLLGRKSLLPGEGLLLIPANSVHTIGMKFSLDLVFIDGNGLVLKTIEQMPPGRISPIVKKSAAVLELNAGELKKSGTVEGDQLRYEK